MVDIDFDQQLIDQIRSMSLAKKKMQNPKLHETQGDAHGATRIPVTTQDRSKTAISLKRCGSKLLAWIGLFIVFTAALWPVLEGFVWSQEKYRDTPAESMKTSSFQRFFVAAQPVVVVEEVVETCYETNDVDEQKNLPLSCIYNYYWVTDGIAHIVSAFVPTTFIETHDSTLAGDCDDKANYVNLFEYIYSCIYDKAGFAYAITGEGLTPLIDDSGFCSDGDVNTYCENDELVIYQDVTDTEYCLVGSDNYDYCYNSAAYGSYAQPCLLYYEAGVCARCKEGAIRIFTTTGVSCGYVYENSAYVDEDDGAYTSCRPYDYRASDTNEYLLVNRYQNHTSAVAEQFCTYFDALFTQLTNVDADFNQTVTEEGCSSTSNMYLSDDVWNALDTSTQDLAKTTVGCIQCKSDEGYYSAVTYVPSWGIYLQTCDYVDSTDTEVENQLCGDGSILQWEGLIESERTLSCTSCSTLIPNCLSCDSAKNCNLCKSGYSRAEIVDDIGVTNIVCMQSFCGFYGEGAGCTGAVGIEGCDRSSSQLISKVWVESCSRCSPGYYLAISTTIYEASGNTVYLCSPQKDKSETDLFIAPYDSKNVTLENLTYSSTKGTITDPLYSLQQALSRYQGDYKSVSEKSLVVVNIYLFKGVHHFIHCVDHTNVDFTNMDAEANSNYAFLCMNYAKTTTTDVETTDEDGNVNTVQVTTRDFTQNAELDAYIPQMISDSYETDNIKFNIRALDCQYTESYFRVMSVDEKTQFDANCINVANNEKAQIRIANPYTYFNITNYARFENIEFTGEDLFANATLSGSAMTFMDQWGILAFMPFTKCRVDQDPDDLSTIDDITIQRMENLKIDNFDYECEEAFTKNDYVPPTDVDNRCFPAEYIVSPNSANCTGEPYDDNFFEYSTENNAFVKRHKVLFNLYAFDPLRSLSVKPPELEIVGCTFKYFVNKLDALIQVETNNLGYMGTPATTTENDDGSTSTTEDTRFLSYYGEDRGAIITIDESKFVSNSFCKGLIYYNRFQSISYSDAPGMLNFTANFVGSTETNYDESGGNYIRIQQSIFKNSGFHQVIQALNLDAQNSLAYSSDTLVSTIPFRRFQDQGLVLNTVGFSGAIEVLDSVFESNIAYIQEIMMYESLATDTYYDFDDKEMIIEFSNTDQTYLQFKQCQDSLWTARYFFGEVIAPDTFFDDSLVVDTLENVATFMIKGNKGPIIFSNNTFNGNIGTTGGVIHIESPDFRYGDNPFIIMQGNRFTENMAYWAGNAFHIQMKVRMVYGQSSTSGQDAWQTCGAGILIDDNYFYGNVGMKKHNGGAGVIRCQHDTSVYETIFTYRSGKQRNRNVEITSILTQESIDFLDDPSTHKSIVKDLFNPAHEYEVLTYGTWIKGNTFAENYSGKRGTALVTELINQLVIEDNKFTKNGPMHTYAEIHHSPYWKTFLYNQRTITFYLLGQQLGDCKDEPAWFNRCYRDGYEIDMPQVQGALHIRNCHSISSCWFVTEDSDAVVTASYEQVIKYYRPWQSVIITNNHFYDNHANILMFATQVQPQASSLFIYGGFNTTITENKFTDHRNWADSLMKAFAYDVYRFYPSEYFKYSQSTMIRIEYPYEVYADVLSSWASLSDKPINTIISNNTIADNLNIQVLTYSSLKYKASILEFDCQVQNATLNINGNEITRNQFIGEDSTLFYINGGIAAVAENLIEYNGMLTERTESKDDESYNRQYQSSLFPWEDYDFVVAQEKGIFLIDYNQAEMPIYKAHNFTRNTFRHIYCLKGCAYYVTGSQIQQFSFSHNNYNMMVGKDGAAVFYGDVDLQPSNKLAQVWTQSYQEETFDGIYGGAIELTGNNVPITFITKSFFINNFGSKGAAISLNQGGGLYILDSKFVFEYQNQENRVTLHGGIYDIGFEQNMLDTITKVGIEAAYAVKRTYNSRLRQDFILSDGIIRNSIETGNNFGQVYLKLCKNTVANDQQPVFGYDNKVMSEVIKDIWGLDLISTEYSSIRDSLFQDNIGKSASAIYLDNSYLELQGSAYDKNFVSNISPQGPTIFATFSKIRSSSMDFSENAGYQGACYLLDSTSELTDQDSVYMNNKASQGGVTFAINDSKFNHTQVRFVENIADDGAVLYAMYNSNQQALSYTGCEFTGNRASQNLMQLMSSQSYISDSTFTDNSAVFVNHGITMITSNMTFYNSTVTFSEGFADTLDLSKLDCGFFSLFLSSTITMGNNSKISNLKALNQAVLSGFSLSSVHITNNVIFENNQAISSAGQTISLQNPGDVFINQAHFQDNMQTNIQVQLGTMSVTETTFTNGSKSHISGIDSKVTLEKVHMYNSTSTEDGHGFTCSRCSFVGVIDSTFENLTSSQGWGGAVKIHKQYNETEPVSYLINNTFTDNTAMRGGAILLDRTQSMQVSGNNFTGNEAVSRRQGDGGAILYQCDPTDFEFTCTVALLDNIFTFNKADRKGGALRYENANFTDVYLLKDDQITKLRNLQTISNSFASNEAAYGANMASFPQSIKYEIPRNTAGARINSDIKNLLIAAGQEFEMNLLILDQEGRIYTDENQAIAKINFVSGQDLGTQALMLGSDAVATNGTFSFKSFKVRIQPSTSAQISFSFQGLEHFGTEIDFLDNVPIFNVTARQCVKGEQYTEDLSCKPCPAAFYLYEIQDAPGVCKDCSSNANCYGMNITAPKPGYWRSDPIGEVFTECLRPESCLGGSELDPLGTCDTGYQGILCSDCQPGFSRAALNCNECPAPAWNIIIFCALIILVILAIAFLVRSTLGGTDTEKPLYQVYLKIFLNHFQILAAVAQIDFKWPALIQSVLASQQGVADGPSQVLSVDCIMMNLFGTDEDTEPPLRLNYVRLILFTIMPFLIFAFSHGFWASYGRCARVHAQERNDKATATSIIVLFLFYPTIVSIIAKSINCVEIEGVQRLYDDLEEVCYQGTHLMIILTVSIPGLIAWAIGIPVYAMIKLFGNVKKLRDIQEFSAGKQFDDLQRRFKVRLGFLTAGYSDTYFYWEIILLMRKTLIVLMIVFLSAVSSGVQSLSSILVLTIFFMIHRKVQPYYDPALNYMETLSLFVIILTIYAGLYYQTAQGDAIMENQVVTWIVFCAVLFPSIAFAVDFGKKMWIEILKIVAKKNAKVFRYLTCGTKDLTQFRLQYFEQDSDQEEGAGDEEFRKKAPKTTAMVGFKAGEDSQIANVKDRISKRKKMQLQSSKLEKEAGQKIEEENPKDQQQKVNMQNLFENDDMEESEVESLELGTKNDAARGSSSQDGNPGLMLFAESEGSSEYGGRARQHDSRSNMSQSMLDITDDQGLANSKIMQIQKQNFEYKDEVQFRGEKVSAPDIQSKSSFRSFVDDVDDRTKNSSTNLQGQPKAASSTMVDPETGIAFNASSSFGATGLGNFLGKINQLNEEDENLKTRNNQSRIKSGLQKQVGVTSMVSKDGPQGKNARQAQSAANPFAALANMKKDDDEMSDPEEMASSPRKRIKNVPSPKSALSDFHGFDGKSISVIGKGPISEVGSTGTRFNNIFKGKNDGKSVVSTSPAFKKEQIVEKPRLLFAKKRDPKKVSDNTIDDNVSQKLAESEDDEDFLSDEEGFAGKSIRGNTQRRGIPPASKRTEKSSRSKGRYNANKTGRSEITDNAADVISNEEGFQDKSIRGETKRDKRNIHQITAQRQARQDKKSVAAASEFNDDDDVDADLDSNEEDFQDKSIRGNTQRVPKGQKSNRTSRSRSQLKNQQDDQVQRPMQNNMMESRRDDESDMNADMISVDESRMVPTIRGNTQRREEPSQLAQQVENIFYQQPNQQPDDNVSVIDEEALEVSQNFGKRKRKRNRNKKRPASPKFQGDQGGKKPAVKKEMGGKNKLANMLQDMKNKGGNGFGEDSSEESF